MPASLSAEFMRLLLVTLTLMLASCTKQPESNIHMTFDTPEGAILMLEDAYKSKNIEAAVAAKDFQTEAHIMLKNIMKDLTPDQELIKQAAETLELSFRNHLEKDGFPDFTGLRSTFPHKELFPDHAGVVIVTEVCYFPDGGTSTQRLLVSQTPKGWRVLNLLNETE